MLLSIIIFILLYCVCALYYAYQLRGQTRYTNFSEYIRKGWPVFTPINCLLYIFTKKKGRGAILHTEQYRDLVSLRDNWQIIRDEVKQLYEQGYFSKTVDPESKAYYDLGFRTFYKYGWSKFYLKWYGYQHQSALKLCPKTSALLKNLQTINGAMFALLPSGSKLTRHLDPIAASLRYHLGLITPNDDSCFINIDGTTYSWRDGEDFLFDETYLHFANNNSQDYRLILMCDVNRPTNIIGSTINWFVKLLLRGSIVPNTAEDKGGFVNKTFSAVSPIKNRIQRIKGTNIVLYKIIKHCINLVALAIVVGIITLIVFAIIGLVKLL